MLPTTEHSWQQIRLCGYKNLIQRRWISRGLTKSTRGTSPASGLLVSLRIIIQRSPRTLDTPPHNQYPWTGSCRSVTPFQFRWKSTLCKPISITPRAQTLQQRRGDSVCFLIQQHGERGRLAGTAGFQLSGHSAHVGLHTTHTNTPSCSAVRTAHTVAQLGFPSPNREPLTPS